jgi:hypothetical protein
MKKSIVKTDFYFGVALVFFFVLGFLLALPPYSSLRSAALAFYSMPILGIGSIALLPFNLLRPLVLLSDDLIWSFATVGTYFGSPVFWTLASSTLIPARYFAEGQKRKAISRCLRVSLIAFFTTLIAGFILLQVGANSLAMMIILSLVFGGSLFLAFRPRWALDLIADNFFESLW